MKRGGGGGGHFQGAYLVQGWFISFMPLSFRGKKDSKKLQIRNILTPQLCL